MSKQLGKIQKVELRNAWKHEAIDFTNWLAEDENLQLLSDEIGIEIKLVQTEASVGRYNIDILAEEETSNNKIVIENQLEPTNHDHLGKLITYASGVEASVVIWVVKDVREEHRQAIDWLNEHTDNDLAFFLLRIELWQIGDSPFAPKFETVSKPNDWAKSVRRSAGISGEVTETKAQQLEFWEQFKTYAQANKTSLRLQKSYPQHWTDISIGSGLAYVALTLNSFDEEIRTELYIRDNKDVFYFLEKHKTEIEAKLGKLSWMELPGKKASRIVLRREGLVGDTERWEEYFGWLHDNATRFKEVFSKYLKKYK